MIQIPENKFQLSSADLFDEIVIKKSQESQTANLLFFGDLVPTGKVGDTLSSNEPQKLINEIYPDLKNSDLNVINLEAPLTNCRTKLIKEGPVLVGKPDTISGIKKIGFKVINLANNHILDMGEKGLLDTIEACNNNSILTVGAGKNINEASAPLFLQIKNIRVGIIAVAENEYSIAKQHAAGSAPINVISNFKQVKFSIDKSDVTIVLIHGGLEYYPVPRPGLVEYCRFLVDCGVNAVICNHTHIPSAIEIYKESPIIYGMGNFLFDRKGKDIDWYHGYYTKLSISNNGVFSFQVKPYEQCNGYIGIKALNNNVNNRIIEQIYNASILLHDIESYRDQWEKTCAKLTDKYIIGLRSPIIFNGVGRLVKMFPFLKSLLLLPRKHALRVLNMIRCETHQEVLETVLTLYIKSFKKIQ